MHFPENENKDKRPLSQVSKDISLTHRKESGTGKLFPALKTLRESNFGNVMPHEGHVEKNKMSNFASKFNYEKLECNRTPELVIITVLRAHCTLQ